MERHVPSEYTTIGAAIFACDDGDVVIVAPGTYTGTNNRDIRFLGKAITVRSADPTDPAVVAATVIDCQGSESDQHRGFYFTDGESPDSVLSGFTIINGWIENSHGAGIYCFASSPTVEYCTISANTGPGSRGGGFACTNAAPVLRRCTVSLNSARWGGGIHVNNSDLHASDCTVEGNSADSPLSDAGGGGIYITSSSCELRDCLIRGNSDNTAGATGGGVMAPYSSVLTIANSAIVDNTGSGIQWGNTTLTLRQSTVAGNRASQGGGMRGYDGGGTVEGCILSSNVAEQGSQIALLSNSEIVVSCSNVQGGEADTSVGYDCSLFWGSGNIDIDPLFVDADGPDDDPATWEDNDYHLNRYSTSRDSLCALA